MVFEGIIPDTSTVFRSVLSRATKRLFLSRGQGKFMDQLAAKAEETGVKVLVVGEAYTSKTCSNCGLVNATLGSSKTFKCPNPKCSFYLQPVDRDGNGAANILLANSALFT